jgi:hypothetical protein
MSGKPGGDVGQGFGELSRAAVLEAPGSGPAVAGSVNTERVPDSIVLSERLVSPT